MVEVSGGAVVLPGTIGLNNSYLVLHRLLWTNLNLVHHFAGHQLAYALVCVMMMCGLCSTPAGWAGLGS